MTMADIKSTLKVATAKAGQLKEDVKALDMGVLYTKMEDTIAALDIEGKKQSVVDFLDSPQMDKLKGVARTVKDFCGFVPNYAQSIPGMIKDAAEKIKK